jgi:amino acid adenylation domain-containing protein
MMSHGTPGSAILPASSVQRQFWLLQQLQPESRAYHVASVFRLNGHLNEAALCAAFSDLLARHESLRTTLEEHDGVLCQRIHHNLGGYFEMRAVDALPELADIELEIASKFDLSKGPLLRVRVWQTSAGEGILAWTMHHSVTDLTSKDILSHELAALYESHLHGVLSNLEPVVHQYSCFALAEQEWQRTSQAARAEDYFANHIDVSTPALALPEDFPRPILQSYRGARVSFEVDRDLSSKLHQVAAEQNTKPFLLLLTAYALLLGRYSSASRIVVGIPFTNRRWEATQKTVGCFVNTLPLSVDLTGDSTFSDLKTQIRERMLGHHRHQEMPFERILLRLRPNREPSRNPLYQAGFTFEHPMQLGLSGVNATNLMVHPGGAQLDVFLTMWESEGRFFGHLEYCTDLFQAATVERLIQNYLKLLVSGLASTSTPAHQLAMVSDDERELMFSTWNSTNVEYGRSPLMHELFLEQVSKSPNAVAIRSGERTLTYRELAEYAQTVAELLQTEGVEAGDRVGIYMHRSIEMVVSIFGVLVVGATYVPIDPEFPAQRIEYVLEDAKPKAVVSLSSLRSQWQQAATPLRVVDIDTLARSDKRISTTVTPEAAAYVIFTSGSTGRPKGVAVSHRAICNSMLWMQSVFHLEPSDVLVQTTPYSFDVSTWELLWVFIVGAQLEIPGSGVHRDPWALADLIQKAKVTTIHFVPSMLQVFLDHAPLGSCTSLKRVLCIGEALSFELMQRFHSALPCELHNLYGPTEAAVQASWWQCDRSESASVVSIGKPIANTQFYIVDAHQSPVPVGVPGELYIGGTQVANEYVNRPDLTACAFVPDPFTQVPGARMYRTGDLARWLPDGNIAFLGRTDFQVKVRGFRIELGEIESVLLRHPQVTQAVVVAREFQPGDMRLVAYVVSSGTFPGAASLRQHLLSSLPDYMVPQHFVAIEAMPTNSNGKLDRKLLPHPFEHIEEAEVPSKSRSPMEDRIQEIWAKHLGYRDFSTQGYFFELGGSSLLATRIVVDLEKAFGRSIGVTAMFQFPTVEALARHLTVEPVANMESVGESVVNRAQRQRQALLRRVKSRLD